jgi:hypothetical protein
MGAEPTIGYGNPDLLQGSKGERQQVMLVRNTMQTKENEAMSKNEEVTTLQ